MLILLSVSSAAARADEPALGEARQLFHKGNQQYLLGNFRDALALFRQSLQKASRPNTLFNIAQCHRQLKQREEALFNYKLYLSAWERERPGTEAPHQDEVHGWIARLEAELEQARAEQRRRQEAARARSDGELRARHAPGPDHHRAVRATSPAAAPAATTDLYKKKPFYKKWWFWTITAAVIGGSVTAVALSTGGDDRVASEKDGRFDASNF